MKPPLHILHLEDEPLDAELVQETLLAEGFDCAIQCVETRPEFIAALQQEQFDLILADFALPAFDGMAALTIAREIRPELPFIFVSGVIGAAQAIEALKRGATDYVLKHLLSELGPAVQRALREVAERHARQQAIEELRQAKEAAEKAAERIASLQVVTAALSEALTPDQVAQAVLEQGLAVLDARAGSIVTVKEATNEQEPATFRALKMVGYTPQVKAQWQQFPTTARVPIADAVRKGRPIFLQSRQEFAEAYPALVNRINDSSYAWATIPLLIEGKPIGAMGLSFGQPRTFSREDRDFMMALGRQCAQALERARLYEAERIARTEAEAARHRLEFLSEASAILAASLDYETTLGQVAQLAVPRLADWCAIDMLTDSLTKRVAVAHVEPEKIPLAYELEKRFPRDPRAERGLPYVLRTGRSILDAHIPESRLEENTFNSEHLDLVRRLGYRAAMIVPLVARGRVLGALTFAIAQSGRHFSEEDLALAEELGRRAALAVDNARLYSEASQLNVELEQRVASRTLELREANRQLADAQKIAHLGSWAWDVTTDVVTSSDELFRIYGLQRHELLPSYEGFLARVHPDDQEYVRQVIQKAIQQPAPISFFHRIVRPDGTIRMLQARGEVVLDDAGCVAQFVGTALDVTELKEAEAQLERNARQLLALGEMGQTVTASLDLPTVLARVLEQLQPLIPAEGLSILLLEPPNGGDGAAMLRFAATSGPGVTEMQGRLVSLQDGLAGRVIQTGHPIATADATRQPHLFRELEQRGYLVRSLVAVPLRLHGQVIGVLEAVHHETAAFDADHLQLLEAAANWTAIAISNARLYEAVEIGREQMRRLSQQAISILEDERRRVSRELHDEAGQALTALRISLGLMKEALPADPPALREQMDDAIQLTGETMEQIRLLAQGLRPPALDTVGLSSVVEGYCRDFAARTRLRLECHTQPVPPLPDTHIITLYRFLQEALTNIVRHAQATWAEVRLDYDGSFVTLGVTDDGLGFDAPSLMSGVEPGGIGLLGMRERLELLEGTLLVESRPGQGTRLVASLPLAARP